MLLIAAAAGFWLLLGAVNIYRAELNQDEGWYLYAAREVSQGRMPYVDFAFTQGPVLPVMYAAGHRIAGPLGVEGGRWLTLGFGGIALVLSGLLGARLSPAGWRGCGAAITVILLGINVYHSQFTATVKTYALCSALLMGGMVLVHRAAEARRPVAGFLGGLLLALAAGTRLSAGVVLAVVCFSLLFRRGGRRTLAWFFIGLGGAIGLAAAFGPLLLAAPEAVRFGLLDYHGARDVGNASALWLYKAGFLSRFAGAYLVAAGAAVALGLLHLVRPTGPPAGPADSGPSLVGLVWGCGLAVSLVHLAAPFPYDDYQVVAAPLFCAAIGASFSGWFRARLGDDPSATRWPAWTLTLLLLLSVAASFSSPINQQWVVGERDRIWWRPSDRSSLRLLQDVASRVREAAGPETELLTQDTYLAVEAGLAVPRGMEMGPFSYFPGLPTDRAERLHLLNRERLEAVLRSTPAPVAAFSGYGLTIASPGITELPAREQAALEALVNERFDPWMEVPDFGQARTTLRLFRRAAPDGESGDPRP